MKRETKMGNVPCRFYRQNEIYSVIEISTQLHCWRIDHNVNYSIKMYNKQFIFNLDSIWNTSNIDGSIIKCLMFIINFAQFNYNILRETDFLFVLTTILLPSGKFKYLRFLDNILFCLYVTCSTDKFIKNKIINIVKCSFIFYI